MTLMDLAAIGSFVSGVAVVFSFLFLGLQIRQSNKNQRSQTQQGRYIRVVDSVLRYAEPHLRDTMMRGRNGDLSMQSSDVDAFLSVTYTTFLNFEDTFLQHQAGTIDPSAWATAAVRLRGILTRSGNRVAWKRNRMNFQGAFAGYVDELLKDTPLALPSDIAAEWKADVTAELTNSATA